MAAARSWRGDLEVTTGQRAVDAVPQAVAARDEGGLFALIGPRGELGAGPHRCWAPLHAGVLRAELGNLDRRRAAFALDPLVIGVPLVGPAALVPDLPGQWAYACCQTRFSATSASHPATARVVSTSNSYRATMSGAMSSTSV